MIKKLHTLSVDGITAARRTVKIRAKIKRELKFAHDTLEVGRRRMRAYIMQPRLLRG